MVEECGGRGGREVVRGMLGLGMRVRVRVRVSNVERRRGRMVGEERLGPEEEGAVR